MREKGEYLQRVPRLKQRTAEALAAAEEAADTPEEQELMRRLRQGYDHFFHEYDKILARPTVQGIYPTILQLIDTVLTEEILAPAHEYRRLNEEMLAEATRANQEAAAWLTSGLLALGVCGSVGGIL